MILYIIENIDLDGLLVQVITNLEVEALESTDAGFLTLEVNS